MEARLMIDKAQKDATMKSWFNIASTMEGHLNNLFANILRKSGFRASSLVFLLSYNFLTLRNKGKRTLGDNTEKEVYMTSLMASNRKY